jgi:septal ring factor EnvC (AmiA/AmiB activator)
MNKSKESEINQQRDQFIKTINEQDNQIDSMNMTFQENDKIIKKLNSELCNWRNK